MFAHIKKEQVKIQTVFILLLQLFIAVVGKFLTFIARNSLPGLALHLGITAPAAAGAQ